ncbi:hypothetical protein [Flavicella sediminum]|uniref:hypothetical protein n=1 Tax=Flavicella sediminum TaxID=2585141 RepID=UPI001121844D|nr:hypothetical protein [Flavicella sediminum]
MKKSNYIIIAFAVFFFGLITTMYVDAANNGENNFKKNNTLVSSDQNLDNFSVIVAHKNTKIVLLSHNQNLLTESYYQHKDSTDSSMKAFQKKCDYRVQNDTLYIDRTYKAKVTIKTTTVKTILARESSNMNFKKVESDSLTLYLTNAKVNYSNLTLNHLKVTATENSNINLGNSKIKSIQINLDQSKINSYRSNSNSVLAVLKNKSNLTVSKPNNLHIESDRSSTYRTY